jgi:hypothetical protein
MYVSVRILRSQHALALQDLLSLALVVRLAGPPESLGTSRSTTTCMFPVAPVSRPTYQSLVVIPEYFRSGNIPNGNGMRQWLRNSGVFEGVCVRLSVNRVAYD